MKLHQFMPDASYFSEQLEAGALQGDKLSQRVGEATEPTDASLWTLAESSTESAGCDRPKVPPHQAQEQRSGRQH